MKIVLLLRKLVSLLKPKYDDPIECPKCGSENSETYVTSRKQSCLDCGHKYRLPRRYYRELAEAAKGHMV